MALFGTSKKEKISWTRHAERKLRYYQLSKSRALRVLRHPERKEKGIAPGTLAFMQRAGSKKHPYEVWLMYQTVKIRGNTKTKIISTWKYPGMSPLGQPIPIPEDIIEELKEIIK